MVQNIQNTCNETHLALDSTDSKSSGPQVDTLKVVTCPVCRAVYVPYIQKQRDGYNGSFTLLETAFLRVCHFCFRCQRPACPQCWNQEYNLCAACSKVAHVPFHSPLSSFEGLIFSPPVFAQMSQASALSFACLRNGHSHAPAHLSVETTPGDALVTEMHLESPVLSSASPYPSWLQEIMGQGANEPASDDVRQMDAPPAESADMAEQAHALPHTNSSTWPQTTRTPDTNSSAWLQTAESSARVLQPSSTIDRGATPEEDGQEPVQEEEKLTPVERVENVLIYITSLLLALIVVMIILALSSAELNMLFLRFLHIDIRAEIAYLLQLI
jgi:hypothetical protein